MRALFFTSPVKNAYIHLGRCGGRSKGGEKWPPVKLMFAAGGIRDISTVRIIDAESRISEKIFIKEVVSFGPDILIFEPTPATIADDSAYLEIIQGLLPEALTVATGSFASPLAEDLMLKFGSIDFVICGETEVTLRDFVLLNGKTPVRGMWYRDNGVPKFSGNREMLTDLNELPFPAHDLIDKKIYRSPLVKRTPFTITESSRGCPYPCIFCNAYFMDGKTPRYRSPENLLKELRFIKNCGFREVKFNDETFTFDKERTVAFAEMLSREDLGLSWKCNTRADCLDDDILKAISKAGCHTIFMGVESSNPKILDFYGKKVSGEKVKEVVRLAKERNIRTVLHFMFGAPDENWDDIKDSISFACDANPDFAGFNILTPYPGTGIYRRMLEDKLIISSDWRTFDQSCTAVIRTKHLSAGDLEQAVKAANREFYLRPGYIMKRVLEIRRPGDFIRNFVGLANMLRRKT